MKKKLMCFVAALTLSATMFATDKTVDLTTAYTTSTGATWSNGTFTWTAEGDYVDIPLGDISGYYELDINFTSSKFNGGDAGIKLINAADNTDIYSGGWWSGSNKQYAFQYVSGINNSLRLPNSKLGNVTLRLTGGVPKTEGGTYTLSSLVLKGASMSCVPGTPVGKLTYTVDGTVTTPTNLSNTAINAQSTIIYGNLTGSEKNYCDLTDYDAINVDITSIQSAAASVRFYMWYKTTTDATSCTKIDETRTLSSPGTITFDLTSYKTGKDLRLNFLKSPASWVAEKDNYQYTVGNIYLTKANDPVKYYLSGQKVISGSTVLATAQADANCTAVDVSAVESFKDPNATALLDFDATAFTNKNCLFIAPSTATKITTNNVIAGTTCANLSLTDGSAFAAPQAFTATNATYSRTMTTTTGNRYGTIILPYAVTNSDYKFFTINSINSTQMVLTAVASIEANKPYVYRLNADADATTSSNSALAATEAAIAITPTALTQDAVNGTTLTGTYTPLSLSASAGAYYYFGTGDKIYRSSETTPLTVNPFRAYFNGAITNQANQFNMIEGGETTAINQALNHTPLIVTAGDGEIAFSANQIAPVAVYNEGGMLVKKMQLNAGEDKAISLPAGMYVVNGMKVIVK